MTAQKNKPELEQQVIVVTFQLGSQTYALPISPVRQIIEMVKITPLPQVSDIIVGVINFHGVMVPVVSMRRLLGMGEIPLNLHTPIILVHMSERLVGLIVDKVLDVIGRAVNQVIDPKKILLKEMGETPLLQGLIQTQAGSILLLNPEHLFEPYQSRALTEAIQTQIQSMEKAVSDNGDGSPDQKNPARKQPVDRSVQSKPKVKEGNPPTNRSRKKAAAVPKSTEEVAP